MSCGRWIQEVMVVLCVEAGAGATQGVLGHARPASKPHARRAVTIMKRRLACFLWQFVFESNLHDSPADRRARLLLLELDL